MTRPLETDADSVRVRGLMTVGVRRRYRRGLAALPLALFLFVVAAALVHRVSAPVFDAVTLLGLAACATALWEMWPAAAARRRRPWSLVLGPVGIDAWIPYDGIDAPTAPEHRHLAWDDCVKVIVHPARRPPDLRIVVVLGFHGPRPPQHLQDVPATRLLVHPDRPALDTLDELIRWLREHRPDVPLVVSEQARELGVHRLGR
jgi:hypothetical protein